MILLRRLLALFTPVLATGLLVLLQYQPVRWPWIALGLCALLFFTLSYMLKWALHRGHFWMTLFPLLSFAGGTVGLLFFLTNPLPRWIIILFFLLAVGLYFETVFTKYFQEQKYTQLSLPMVSFVLNVLGAFALFASLFGLHLIDVLPMWVLLLCGLLWGASITAHQLWSYQIWNRHAFMCALVVGLVTAEVVWVLHFWPTAFFINGIIISILLYCVPSLIQLQLRQALTAPLLWRYVGLASGMSVLVLVTSSWS